MLFNQSNCCYVATQKKVMATTYYVIYIHTIGSATLLQTYPLVAIPTVIIFPMKLTRKWFLIIVSAVTPVIYRLFIYECSIYSKLGIKKKNLSMKKKTFWYHVCVIWCYQNHPHREWLSSEQQQHQEILQLFSNNSQRRGGFV